MKFLLIRPAYQEEKNKSHNITSMHEVELLDYYAEKITKDKLKNSLMSCDAVGMTVNAYNLKPAAGISGLIKEIDSDIPLIIGGLHCTFVQKQSLYDIPHADISVAGEGEFVILDLAKYLQGEKNLANIHGIYYKENGSIISGKPPKIINNLDDLPFPARHLVEKYDYGNFSFGFSFTLKGKITNMITSTGCPFHCRFCSRYSHFIKDWSFRERSAESVVNEIQELSGKYRSVVIVDDNFLAD